jgi:hypothetical protein
MKARRCWKVAAQGHFITRLGSDCFVEHEAVEMAAELRTQGYADAHAQRAVRGLGPLALTLVVRGPPR